MKDLPVFSGLAPELLRVMAYLGERQVYAPGQVILAAGEPAETTVIMVDGMARIEAGGRDGSTVTNGMCVGAMALLGRFRWISSLRAEAESICLLLPRRKFRPQLMAQPDALVLVAQELIGLVIGWEQGRIQRDGDRGPSGLGML